jgi:hypothetical protein
MDRGRVGEDRGSKDTDGCPLTVLGSVRAILLTWRAHSTQDLAKKSKENTLRSLARSVYR